jgi:hypothetical protein
MGRTYEVLRKAFYWQWAGLLLPVVTFEFFKFFFGAEPLGSTNSHLSGSLMLWLVTYYLSWLVGLLLYAMGVQDILRATAHRWHKLLAIVLPLLMAIGLWALGIGGPW